MITPARRMEMKILPVISAAVVLGMAGIIGGIAAIPLIAGLLSRLIEANLPEAL